MSRVESGDRSSSPASEAKSAQGWKAAEAAREKRETAAKIDKLREGLLGHYPATHDGMNREPVLYGRITALIYRPHPHADGFRLAVELKDRGTTSVTVAATKDVTVHTEVGSPRKAEIDPEAGQRIRELKAAMRGAYTADYKGVEYRRISAIYIRSPEPGKIAVEAELVEPDCGGVVLAPGNEIEIRGHRMNRA